ncbi:MAG: alpha/beta hydrolase [Clostridiales bacterium]|nr:alpha/beta hydrolase [Clostridiales bacterium]
MLENTYTIWKEEEYSYAGAFGFVPNIHTYIHEDEQIRPCVLVVPGGGYRIVSPTEGGIVAKRFYEAGYQAIVLTYITDLINVAPLKRQPLNDISRAVRYIRKNADVFKVNTDRMVAVGFSAGAHLTGSLAVHWQDVEDTNPEYKNISNKLQGVILSYPVITSGEKAHRDSFDTLCGKDASEEELTYFSLEKQVTDQTPPVFLWQTVTDEDVPVENSMLMASALQKAGVPFEYHLFPKGPHGLSLSNEEWATGKLGKLYTMQQIVKITDAIKNDLLPVPEEAKKQLLTMFGSLDTMAENSSGIPMDPSTTAVKEVSVWPELAITWLEESVFEKQ